MQQRKKQPFDLGRRRAEWERGFAEVTKRDPSKKASAPPPRFEWDVADGGQQASRAAAPRPEPSAEAKRPEQTKPFSQARSQEQTKPAEQPKAQPKPAEQSRAKEQAKPAEQAKAPEQAKPAEREREQTKGAPAPKPAEVEIAPAEHWGAMATAHPPQAEPEEQAVEEPAKEEEPYLSRGESPDTAPALDPAAEKPSRSPSRRTLSAAGFSGLVAPAARLSEYERPPEPELPRDSGPRREPEPEPSLASDPEPEPDLGPRLGPDPEPKLRRDPDPKPPAQEPQFRAEPEPTLRRDPEPEPASDPEPQLGPAPEPRLGPDPAPERGPAASAPEGEANVQLAVPPGFLHRAVSTPRAHPILASSAILVAVLAVAGVFTLQSGADLSGPSSEGQTVAVDEPPLPPQQAPKIAESSADWEQEAGQDTGTRSQDGAPGVAAPSTGERSAETAMQVPTERPEEIESAQEDSDASGSSGGAAEQTGRAPSPEQVAALAGRNSGSAETEGAVGPDGANNLVAGVQRALLWRGFDPGPVDGRRGARTSAAVRAFQRKIGVEADGVVDLEVWRQLQRVQTAPHGSGGSVSSAPAEGEDPTWAQFAAATPDSGFATAEIPDSSSEAASSSESPPKTAAEPDPQAQAQQRANRPAPETVRAVQRALRRLGYEPGPADGVEGPKTRAAVRAFQQQRGLAVDGRIDPALLDRLNSSAATRTAAGEGSVEGRLRGAVKAVANMLGFKVSGEVDPEFAKTRNSRDR